MADTKPQMRSLTVAVDQGTDGPKVFNIEAAYYAKALNADVYEFKDNDGKIVLTVPVNRVVYIYREQDKPKVTITYASGGIVGPVVP